MKASNLIVAIVGAALWASPVASEPFSREGQSEDDWRYTFDIYAFLPARTTGTSSVAGTDVDLDLDFGDALELLGFAAAGRFEAWRSNWGFIFDANSVSLVADGALPTPGDATFDVDIRQKWFALLAAYKVADSVDASGRRYAFDLQAGVRYNAIRQKIKVSTPAVQPVLGARGMWELNDRWAMIGSLDLGEFGAGT